MHSNGRTNILKEHIHKTCYKNMYRYSTSKREKMLCKLHDLPECKLEELSKKLLYKIRTLPLCRH